MRIATRRFAAALPLTLCLLVAPGCDEGPEQLRDAETEYRALIDRKVPPKDPAWDAVIAALEAVPRDSKARPEAERRLAAIRALRSELPPRPLATPGATGPGTDAVDAKRAACEALAQKLGQARDEKAREPLQQALAQCRADLTRLEAHGHPPGEQGHEHGGETQGSGSGSDDAGR
ncbi:hypothetical protein [Myxococcus sp. RHSTA-1-4]|uniref:hypothetical protein n=1 Tax=Myxococcus sp. RHSTA-1-4 TaxID=2874601 RepID=UPI001CC036E0|nr:hypothetical protein [Myxococcus sp. RHSTA-1-4]MBZ4416120.1 hypothetical protein [Myxococcus sp. RHSTA-1-4]